MRQKAVLLLSVICILGIESCKKPFACFTVEEDTDNLHVNQIIYFNAVCSNNAKEFFWEFSDTPDSLYFNEYINHTFTDTGTVRVTLTITGSGSTSNYSSDLNIKP